MTHKALCNRQKSLCIQTIQSAIYSELDNPDESLTEGLEQAIRLIEQTPLASEKDAEYHASKVMGVIPENRYV